MPATFHMMINGTAAPGYEDLFKETIPSAAKMLTLSRHRRSDQPIHCQKQVRLRPQLNSQRTLIEKYVQGVKGRRILHLRH